jgi:hypothetical protein
MLMSQTAAGGQRILYEGAPQKTSCCLAHHFGSDRVDPGYLANGVKVESIAEVHGSHNPSKAAYLVGCQWIQPVIANWKIRGIKKVCTASTCFKLMCRTLILSIML